jgi:Big-like domain-containing protein
MDSQANQLREKRRFSATDRTISYPIRFTILVTIAAALATIALVVASGANNSALAASSLVNGNFETGDLTGWTVDTTNGEAASAVRGSTYVHCGLDGICGPRGTIFPKDGSYFALLGSGIQQSQGPRISQPFEASNGDKVSGWAFVNTDSWVYLSYDTGQVVIKSDSGTTVATPFEEMVTFGNPYWRYWEYTFSGLTGESQFQIEARLQNTGEDQSTMGLDDVKLTTTPDNDTTAPDTTITSGPNGPTNSTAPTFTFSGSDNATTAANLKYQYRLDSGGWSTTSTSTTATPTGLSEGVHLFEVRAVDEAGNVDGTPAQRSFTEDTTAPNVESVIPKEDAKGVARTTNVTVTFSEGMREASVKSAFKLYKKGTTTALTATVNYDATNRKATLDPSTNLRFGRTYRAVVSTGAKDLADNPLAQQKAWFFTVG